MALLGATAIGYHPQSLVSAESDALTIADFHPEFFWNRPKQGKNFTLTNAFSRFLLG